MNFELAGMPDPLKHQVDDHQLRPADALVIEKTALKEEDKLLLAKKVAEGKIPGGRKLMSEILPSISRAPKEAVFSIRDKETNWDDVKRAEARKAERAARGPIDTVSTLELEVRTMIQRWVDTLNYKGKRRADPPSCRSMVGTTSRWSCSGWKTRPGNGGVCGQPPGR